MENSYTDAAAAASNTGRKNSKGEVATTKSKKWKCLTATSFIIIMLMLITGCFVLLFLELANLKSELSSFKQTLPSERAQQLNTSIEGSFSTIEDRFEEGDDPLWDGAGCGPMSTCCAPPWFYKQLPQPTTDDIEMRVCRDEDASNEDIAIEMVEIYIQ